MLEDSLTLYKLIILYMLNRVTFPLTTAQISDFILEMEYTNFLTLQQVINELLEANMISAKTVRNRTHLEITREGRDTLRYFGSRIGEAIKEDINHYLREKEYTLRNEVSVLADYYKSTSGEYEARLVARERDTDLIHITLSVPTEELASSICCNWQNKNQEIYRYLMQELFQ
ncbi:MAG: DUF4364 family protein [Roseburia sp.]|nr:DUF4364 family protein [Roseburia sp.]